MSRDCPGWFKWYIPKFIPTTFEQALSYYECLLYMERMVDEINKSFEELEKNLPGTIRDRALAAIKPTVDKINADFAALVADNNAFKDAVNAKFGALESEIDSKFASLESSVNQALKEVQTTLDQKSVEIDTKLAAALSEMEKALQEMQTTINQQYAIIRSYVDAQVETAKAESETRYQQLEKMIQDLQFTLPEVDNPVYGGQSSITQALYDLFETLRYGGLTALEFDSLGLTAEEFDTVQVTPLRRGMTALEFSVSARWILQDYAVYHTMFNPFTGKKDTVKHVVYRIATDLVDSNLTALEFEETGVDCELFDSYEMAAEVYDFEAKTVLDKAVRAKLQVSTKWEHDRLKWSYSQE